MDLTVSQLIPQRYPFQLIDRFERVTPGQAAQAQKLVTINEWYFKSATQGGRVVPRPLLLEMLAQTGVAAILTLPTNRKANVFFGGISQADFLTDVQPGAVLTLNVTLTKLKRRLGTGHGTITCHGQLVATADLIFAIQGGD
ncbi:3-hydroxyacyl-ACP dehydratase FabZ family protein [Lactiplantibacillus fabifermentans]|uniref:(3r)-hydroxymyristoyl-(Acyl carrier protein) dehydratase n=2 Tax=Lactiplantibacillus fabifermentans TaxID=483011 RepID=A0A0R2NS54_9LACO|nr:3-hydroxyacyl-ACP dehydratase FabZ family protein [Lactiplantibacillus fabifermentans]ETY74410.1 3-hydroxyacyl-ACP dehydratase [Lactiplantibacillus fabifermentans T30PCM01]KRO28236.1 (3r)-hydroxymyristoyl-(acyl carrier protein) dehydratase [Lactiplantibacillus fabifermentans DSM 21115]